MYQLRSPRLRAASTKSSPIRSSATLRVTRAIGGMNRMPTATAVLTKPGGVTARISSTSMIGGNDIMTSNARISNSLARPGR